MEIYKYLEELIKEILPNICLLCKSTLKTNSLLKNLCPLCFSKLEFKDLKLEFLENANYQEKLFKEASGLEEESFPLVTSTEFNQYTARLLKNLKFYQKRELAPVIAEVLSLSYFSILRNTNLKISAVVPLALSETELKNSGCNYLNLIASYFSKITDLNLETKLLTKLGQEDAKFSQENPYMVNLEVLENLDSKNVLLIADLIDKGNNVYRAAKALSNFSVNVFILGFTSKHRI